MTRPRHLWVERAFPALPPTHAASIAAEALALAAKRHAQHPVAALPPLNLEMPPMALEPALRASPAVRAVVVEGTPASFFGWTDASGVRVAVAHRTTGRTFTAAATDDLALARLAAFAGNLIASAIGNTPRNAQPQARAA